MRKLIVFITTIFVVVTILGNEFETIVEQSDAQDKNPMMVKFIFKKEGKEVQSIFWKDLMKSEIGIQIKLPDGEYDFQKEKNGKKFLFKILISNNKIKSFKIDSGTIIEFVYNDKQVLAGGSIYDSNGVELGKYLFSDGIVFQQEIENGEISKSCELNKENLFILSGWCVYFEKGNPVRSIHYVPDKTNIFQSKKDGVDGYLDFKWGDSLKKYKSKYGNQMMGLSSAEENYGTVDYRAAKFLEKTGIEAYVIKNYTTKPFKSDMVLYFVDNKLYRTAHQIPEDVLDLYYSKIREKYKYPYSTDVDLGAEENSSDSIAQEMGNAMKLNRFSIKETYYNGTIYILKGLNLVKGNNFWLVYEDKDISAILKESLKDKIKID